VLVSALISPRGIPARVVDAAENGCYELVVSRRLLGEMEDVLFRPKFRRYFPEVAASMHLARLLEFALFREEAKIRYVSPDPHRKRGYSGKGIKARPRLWCPPRGPL
jgi:predicted nucleic acid-binding protein